MQDDDGVDHAFKWDSANQRLLAGRRNVGQTSFTYYTLLEGVTDFKVKLEPMRSQESIKTGGGYDLLRRVTIELTVRTTSKSASRTETTENQTVTLSASVMPRRNIW
jgi:hypothetical protein